MVLYSTQWLANKLLRGIGWIETPYFPNNHPKCHCFLSRFVRNLFSTFRQAPWIFFDKILIWSYIVPNGWQISFWVESKHFGWPIANSIVLKFQPGPIRFILVRKFWKEYSRFEDKENCSYACLKSVNNRNETNWTPQVYDLVRREDLISKRDDFQTVIWNFASPDRFGRFDSFEMSEGILSIWNGE